MKYIDTVSYKVLRGVNLALLLLGTVMIFVRWDALPQYIPTHYMINEVNAWGPKWQLWLTWGVAVLCYAAFAVVRFFPEEKWNMPVRLTERNRDATYRMSWQMIQILQIESISIVLYVLGCQCFLKVPGITFLLVSIFVPMLTAIICLVRFAFLPH